MSKVLVDREVLERELKEILFFTRMEDAAHNVVRCVANIRAALEQPAVESAESDKDSVPAHWCTGWGDIALGKKSECPHCKPPKPAQHSKELK